MEELFVSAFFLMICVLVCDIIGEETLNFTVKMILEHK